MKSKAALYRFCWLTAGTLVKSPFRKRGLRKEKPTLTIGFQASTCSAVWMPGTQGYLLQTRYRNFKLFFGKSKRCNVKQSNLRTFNCSLSSFLPSMRFVCVTQISLPISLCARFYRRITSMPWQKAKMHPWACILMFVASVSMKAPGRALSE